jgi:5-amino-6-(5-phospho-D-ribitylamino)uracil phosphatase
LDRYLIALDLDGTLLMSDKNIGSRTKEVIGRVQEAGHKVMIATGRPYRASKIYYSELGLDTPIVNFNGAYIHHPLDPKWGVFHNPIPLEIAKRIVKTCLASELKNIIIEVMDDVYIKNPDPKLVESFKMEATQIIYGPIQDTLKTDPSCVLIQTEDRDLENLLKTLEGEYTDVIEQRSWGYPSNIIEIIGKGINKAIGIQRVAEHLHIPRERIIAFGDEDNDIEMLSFVGHGVAMGNAIERVKTAAKHVTSSNDEEGIANFLETFLLSTHAARE